MTLSHKFSVDEVRDEKTNGNLDSSIVLNVNSFILQMLRNMSAGKNNRKIEHWIYYCSSSIENCVTRYDNQSHVTATSWYLYAKHFQRDSSEVTHSRMIVTKYKYQMERILIFK